MRRFAEIDSAGMVVRVIVADSAEWCADVLGGTWVETFKDRSQRVHFASPGFTYDAKRDAFIPAKPFDSWILDTGNLTWTPPIEKPGQDYEWDEETTAWKVIEPPFQSWTLDPECGCWKAPIPMPEDGETYTWDEEAGNWVEMEA